MHASFESSTYAPIDFSPRDAGLSSNGKIQRLRNIGMNEAAWRGKVICLLRDALIKELLCFVRYNHWPVDSGVKLPTSTEILRHEHKDLSHAYTLARHILELGGELDYSPSLLSRMGQALHKNRQDLQSMITENLKAQYRIIVRYTEIIAEVDPRDEAARRLLTRLMDEERTHADELISWLVN
jgi:bacterioferritin (cytochrome b1)